ncbi:MAG: RNA polymerase sigma factor [Raineya sp.]|nr:RNA polymerase sigma factor [Raineya sp.]
MQEKELIKLCQKGDRKAQRLLYERYVRKLLGICKRYLTDIQDAEDALMNAFLKIFDNIHHLKQTDSLESWLKRIVVNECLSILRKKRMLFVEAETQEFLMSRWENGEDILQTEDLLKCLHQLPEGYRTVFNLYAIEGYSHEEIAQMLGISEGTSKSQLSRARNLLQKYLAQISLQEKMVLQN